jgi:hypothetical protein
MVKSVQDGGDRRVGPMNETTMIFLRKNDVTQRWPVMARDKSAPIPVHPVLSLAITGHL